MKDLNELILKIDNAKNEAISKSEYELILMKVKFISEPLIQKSLMSKISNIKIKMDDI